MKSSLRSIAVQLFVLWLIITIGILLFTYMVTSDSAMAVIVALWTTPVLANTLLSVFVYSHATRNGRNGVRWATAFFVFGFLFSGIAYLLTWPQSETSVNTVRRDGQLPKENPPAEQGDATLGMGAAGPTDGVREGTESHNDLLMFALTLVAIGVAIILALFAVR